MRNVSALRKIYLGCSSHGQTGYLLVSPATTSSRHGAATIQERSGLSQPEARRRCSLHQNPPIPGDAAKSRPRSNYGKL